MKWEYSKKKPDCIECGFVKPLPENVEAIEIVDIYINFMFAGVGNPDFTSMMEILRVEKVDGREDLIKKLMIYVLASLREIHRDRSNRIITNKSKNVGKK